MHLPPLIFDLAIILAVAGFMSFVFQKLKQPVVLGYIIAGLIVGPHTPPFQLVNDIPSIQTWAELGVIFLMFTLGLEFSFRKLLSVGVTAGISAGLEVIFFLMVGYGIGTLLGWSSMDSLFLGAILSISSTTIIIKALDDLKLKSHKFAGLVFGILIVEDLLAILLLVALTSIASSDSFSILGLASTAMNLLIVVGSWFVTGYFIVPRMMSYIGKKGNNEMLTLVSIGLCLSLVVVAVHFGYSAALGAFIMGSILAETKIIHQIESLMMPLKDLFGAIFFVSIGMIIDPHLIWEYKETILLLCFVTIFGKIFITSLGALISGQTLKNSLQVGFSLAQIGEFSFIIAGLGVTLKVTSNKLYPIAVAVSLVTTFTTPYLIRFSGPIADKIESKLPWWIRDSINRYVAWCSLKLDENTKYKDLGFMVFRWLVNGIVVTFIFNFCFDKLAPKLDVGLHIIWLISFIVSLPFIWGMIFTSKANYESMKKERNLLKIMLVFSFPILSSIWIGVLSAKYYSVEYILPLIGISLILVYFLVFKRLEASYDWIEGTFLSAFSKKEKIKESHKLSSLAPWDSHLVNIQVHPNANMVNHTLLNANLRQRFGINVVAIQRGVRTLVAPKPHEVIMPHDTLVVLGTDKELDQARPELEIPSSMHSLFPDGSNYRLRHLKVNADSKLAGVSIRQSGIRDNFHAMVVGVERSNKRLINPDTDHLIQIDDIIWVVGEEEMLNELFKELG